jgi:REP element-mobilizing transposase RayT
MNRPLLQKDRSLRVGERRRMLLSKMIGRFKMVSAKNINLVRKTSGLAVWQRNYYEHVIRNEASLNRIRQYIVDNPAQWEFDEENPGGSVHI